MKKFLAMLLCLLLVAAVFAGCSKKEEAAPAADTPASDAAETDTVIIIGASPTPHAEILEFVTDKLAEKGYTLEIVQYTDYVQPNVALDSGDLDANYFQHQPYLDSFNAENGTNIVSAGAIHYEPLGIYPGKTASLDALANGATVSIPNDTSNEARALLLLEANALITLDPEAGINATVTDIIDNPLNLNIVEIESAQLARSLQDVDISVINGNYAIQAGLNAATDALAKEEADSVAAEVYGNIIAVRAGDENLPKIAALVEVLKSDEVKAFLEEKYEGAVIACK